VVCDKPTFVDALLALADDIESCAREADSLHEFLTQNEQDQNRVRTNLQALEKTPGQSSATLASRYIAQVNGDEQRKTHIAPANNH
jgi:hypothetical protein